MGRRIWLAVIAALLLSSGVPALAQSGGKSGSAKAPYSSQRPKAGGKDTKARRVEMYREIKGQYASELRQNHLKTKECRLQMARLLSEPKPDRVKVKNAVNTMMELKRQEQIILVDQLFDSMDKMTPQQQRDYLDRIVDNCLK